MNDNSTRRRDERPPSIYSQWRGEVRAKTRARELRKSPTEAGQRLWHHLRRHQLDGHRFRRQQPLGDYIVDFFCYEEGLIIEVDGGHHSEQEAYDNERTAWLEAQGYSVLRFWNNEILDQIDAVKEVILEKMSSDR